MAIIALALDGSDRAEVALPHALAQLGPDDTLVLIRIVEPPKTGTTLDWVKSQKYLAQAYLDKKRYELELTVKVATVVRVGSARREIVRVLRDRRVDLLVLSSRGAGDQPPLLGSVSRGVARRAPCPVWVVPSAGAAPVLETVVVALDCSALAESALQFALDWLSPPGRILLVSAQAGLTDVIPLRDYLSHHAHEVRRAGWECEVVISGESAAEAILTLAWDRCASLIVMATHGRRGMARWALGSVAERVARDSSCPVVLINATADWSRTTEEVKRHAVG